MKHIYKFNESGTDYMKNQIIIGKGILEFDPINRTKKHNKQGSWKKTAMIVVNDDTYKYYQWMIQKRFPFIQGVNAEENWLNPPLRGTHVSIINDRITDETLWKKLKDRYNGKEIYFFFNWEGLRNNGDHIYFKVECPMGQEVRDFGNLGEPYFGFHMTIGLVPDESKVKKSHNLNVQKYMINSNPLNSK